MDDFSFTKVSHYGSWLASCGNDKLAIIQTLHNQLGIDLTAAKALAGSAPCYVLTNVSEEEAEALAKALNASGAMAYMKDLSVISKALPYTYGFENNALEREGWSLVDCTEGTGIEDNVSHNGNYIFGFLYTTNPPQYLISPQFDGTTGMTVSFYYKNQMDDYPETFQVGYSTTNRSIDAFTWGNKVTANDEDRWYSLWECESSYSPPALVLSLSNARHPMLPAQSDSHRQRLPVACHPGSLPDNP